MGESGPVLVTGSLPVTRTGPLTNPRNRETGFTTAIFPDVLRRLSLPLSSDPARSERAPFRTGGIGGKRKSHGDILLGRNVAVVDNRQLLGAGTTSLRSRPVRKFLLTGAGAAVNRVLVLLDVFREHLVDQGDLARADGEVGARRLGGREGIFVGTRLPVNGRVLVDKELLRTTSHQYPPQTI